jgi:hypothetical protein
MSGRDAVHALTTTGKRGNLLEPSDSKRARRVRPFAMSGGHLLQAGDTVSLWIDPHTPCAEDAGVDHLRVRNR